MSVDELAASAIRALDEIYFMLRNFDVNSPDAISDLDQVCEFCVYLSSWSRSYVAANRSTQRSQTRLPRFGWPVRLWQGTPIFLARCGPGY